ncbi:MAG: GNAT family N-acetyltransferase [Bacillota bacterium]|nr:GNAT family N-acetyltransferase [Bacillota bacterium]MDI7250092.1 GNAT family N-acetyltransferase [Bacillota bacterium]
MGRHVEVCVRPLRREDLAGTHGILRHPEVMRQTLQLPSLQVGWMSGWLADPQSRISLVAELVHPTGHTGQEARHAVVGMISLRRMTGRQQHVAGLGMSVHPAFHGRGIGTTLMGAALDAADREWQVVRTQLAVYPDNEPALRLYRRFGFREEGRLARVAIRDGTYVDTVVMARIRPDLATCDDVREEGTADRPPIAHGRGTGHLPGRRDTAPGEAGWDAAVSDAEGLEVRPPEPADAGGLVRLYRDPGLIRNSLLVPDPPPDEKEIAEKLGIPPAAPVHVFVAVFRGELCGEVRLAPQRSPRMAHSAQVTLLVPPPGSPLAQDLGFPARPVARALLAAALDLADRWLLLYRLRLDTYPDEEWLFPVLQGLGFVVEARDRMAAARDGRYDDRLVWGRLRPEPQA